MKHLKITGILILISLGFSVSAIAQKDTLGRQTINITSSFKPVLKDAAKINFTAAAPLPDSSKPRLTYSIPTTGMYTAYQPLALKPLALQIDSNGKWSSSNFIKIGFGNYQTPFGQAGFTFGDGKKANLNLFAHYVSSVGSKIENQNFTDAGFSAYGSTVTANKLELYGKFGLDQNKYYLYGYNHDTVSYSKSDILQRFQNITVNAGVRNVNPTKYGLKYHPDLRIGIFSDNHKASETDAVLDLPLEKYLGDAYGIKLGANFDFTRYTPGGAGKQPITNNIYTLPLALLFKTPNFNLHAGLIPSWDNSTFKLMPDFTADFMLGSEKSILQLGWIMHYDKGSYQRFASINPYLSEPTQLLNTRVTEAYGGFKGTITDYFTYNAKVGYVEFNNMPLFVNDYTNDGKTFLIRYESELQALELQGEVGFSENEDFSLSAGFKWLQFTKQETEAKPWGIPPRQLNASLRWAIMKDLWLKSDLYFFQAPKYLKPDGDYGTHTNAMDFNAGVEFRITKQLNLWAQANNIFNKKYQRWNQYETYGFNILGGITFKFDQKNK
ncbi:MAG: hypothetical protein C5B52_07860 [Bacteroidetes bacterium]|nr:MAG: hypothetical protein C5B52_07860 [Bacteroidota bacterium]